MFGLRLIQNALFLLKLILAHNWLNRGRVSSLVSCQVSVCWAFPIRESIFKLKEKPLPHFQNNPLLINYIIVMVQEVKNVSAAFVRVETIHVLNTNHTDI